MNNINIWGIRLNPLRKAEIVERIHNHLTTLGSSMFHLTGVNPETISQSLKNQELKKAINDSDLVNIDNMLIVLCLRLQGYKIPERAACPDLFELLLELGNTKGYSVYFLGAKEEVLQSMLLKLRSKYPDLNVVGARNGYFKPREEKIVVEAIRVSKPDMLFIALPTPQKEVFILKNKNHLGTRFAFGVGGAFDVQAEKVKRAPLWMRNIGLEGMHRAIQNPLNYGKRYFTLYPAFIFYVIKEILKKKSENK